MTDNASPVAHPAALPELSAAPAVPNAAPLVRDVSLFRNVRVGVQAVAGQVELSLGELTALKEDDLLTLDRAADAPIDVVLDGQVVARGELVVIGDSFGVRVTELARLEA